MNEGYNNPMPYWPNSQRPVIQFDPQNRQYSYNFVNSKEEGMNWPIAPGSLLVFKDLDGKHFYTKTLGYSPYDKPIFEVFEKISDTNVQPEQVQAPSYDSVIKDMQKQIDELRSAVQKKNDNFKKNGGQPNV